MDVQDQFTFEIKEGIGVLTIDRPDRLNAVNWELCQAMAALLSELRTNDEVRVIVLTGAGGAFSSGGDAEFLSGNAARPIPGLSDEPLERFQRKHPAGMFAEFTRMIIDVDKPVIAAIEGPCMGAGLAYALACDRRFGSNMITTGRILEADECHKEGLIDELVEEGQALAAAMDYAKKLARGPSVAIDLARHFIDRALNSTLEDTLRYEGVAAVMSAMTDDAREGTAAFLEKRRPNYRGV